VTPAATRQDGTKFGREHLHTSVCIAPTGEESDVFLRGVTPVHVEGEKTAVLAADVTGQALQLSLVIVPSGAIVMEERLNTGYEWDDAI
jgi:hypothetical protein